MAAAESPGFFYARLRAAREAADAATKIRLLLDAIAVRPEDFSQRFAAPPPAAANPLGASPRIQLFQAAVAANQNELAVAAMMPLMDQSVFFNPPPEPSEGEDLSEEIERPGYRRSSSTPFLSGLDLSAGQKSVIAAQMASAFQKLDRLQEATGLWKVVSVLATDDSLRSQASDELEHVQAQMKLERADLERQPVITDHLEQKGWVRPRLPRRSARSVSPSLEGGADQ